MVKRNLRNFFLTAGSWGILLIAIGAASINAAEIRTGVEVEFRTFYLRGQNPNFSFQLHEAKLFFDTFISERSSALIEFTLRGTQVNGKLERGYFIWRFQKINARVKFGQFRIPFGYWDTYTIAHSLIKDSFIGRDAAYPDFKLRRLDVGVEVSARKNNFTGTIAVLNGNSIGQMADNNNQKDFVARLGYQSGFFIAHFNTYLGTEQKRKGTEFIPFPNTRNIYGFGGDLALQYGQLSASGELISINYSPNQSIGGYIQFNYNLLPYIFGMRIVGKFEYWDPDRRIANDEVYQSIFGFKQSITRGMTVQLEYTYISRQIRTFSTGVTMEVELEL